MAIFDTFLFADKSEKELLLAKLIIEEDLVDHWLIVDTAFSNTGRFKGHSVNTVLKDDIRFRPYLSRITVIEHQENYLERVLGGSTHKKHFVINSLFKNVERFLRFTRHQVHYLKKGVELGSVDKLLAYAYEESFRQENRVFMRVESYYRDLTRPYLEEMAGPKDFIFISDVDEILDGQTLGCKSRIRELTLHGGLCQFMRFKKRKRLWDFHNLDITNSSYVPLVNAQYVFSHPRFSFNLMRQSVNAWTPYTKLELVHEYSSCYDISGIVKKYSYHVDLSRANSQDLEISLSVNKNLGLPNSEPSGWCEFVDLSKDHQPNYIKESFERLCTNNVDSQYITNRASIYPSLFAELRPRS